MKKLTLLFLAILVAYCVSAQETVRLTVNGQGATKEEATANALRSAIEQSFGVFVSANTQILNDEVIKDEIATISSGNIQEYKELGCVTMPNGQQSVTLSAVVSIGNLISYAKNKGSSAEFAGQLFAMNMKMHKLNAENEKKAIEHMLEQLKILAKGMFRIEMNIKDQPKRFLVDHNIANEYVGHCDDDIRDYIKRHISSQLYAINLEFKYYTTPQCKAFYDLLFNTLESLSLSKNDIELLEKSGMGYWTFCLIDFAPISSFANLEDNIIYNFATSHFGHLQDQSSSSYYTWEYNTIADGKLIPRTYLRERISLDISIKSLEQESNNAETISNRKKREKALYNIKERLAIANYHFKSFKASYLYYISNSFSQFRNGSNGVNIKHKYVFRTDPDIISDTLEEILFNAQAEAYNLYLEGCGLRIQADIEKGDYGNYNWDVYPSYRLNIMGNIYEEYKERCPSLHMLAFEESLLYYTSNAFLLLTENEIANLKKIEIIF